MITSSFLLLVMEEPPPPWVMGVAKHNRGHWTDEVDGDLQVTYTHSLGKEDMAPTEPCGVGGCTHNQRELGGAAGGWGGPWFLRQDGAGFFQESGGLAGN